MARSRIAYWRRIAAAYLTRSTSQLSFWHDLPAANPAARFDALGEYYMPFAAKAKYEGLKDSAGVPMLDYHGDIGPQYNPIAIAQYALGNFNQWSRTSSADSLARMRTACDWLVTNLEPNAAGIPVWHHRFDWEYRDTLRAPWYSGLAQGQGISALLRAHVATGDPRYGEAAQRAFESLTLTTDRGGVLDIDKKGYWWIEEYLVDPPTHILNGFIWALWGVYDYRLVMRDDRADTLYQESVRTLRDNLQAYDTGFWSMYEQSGTRMRMLASPFYHALHVTQLEILHRMTGETVFLDTARRWSGYRNRWLNRKMALVHKSVFKLCYY